MLGRFDLVETIINSRPRLWDPCQFLPPLWVLALQSLFVPLDTAEVVLSDMDHTLPTDAATEANLLALVLEVKQRGFSKPMKLRHRAAAQAHTAKDLTCLLQGYPALHVAICGSGIQMVALLLKHGADPNQYCEAYLIQLAAGLGSLEIVKILIEYGYEVDAFGTNHRCDTYPDDGYALRPRRPAICHAWETCQLEIVRILLDAGVKFTEHDQAIIHNICNYPVIASFAPRDHKGDDAINLEDYSDPWVYATTCNETDGLRHIIQLREVYIGHGMSTAHLARCILIHGTSDKFDFIMDHGFLNLR
jgi:hypothetical protein